MDGVVAQPEQRPTLIIALKHGTVLAKADE